MRIPRRDVIGQKYGRLLAVETRGKDKHSTKLWLWRCDCGNEIVRVESPIRLGHVVSCGCYNAEQIRKAKNIAGMKFGMLTAISEVGRRRNNAEWRCCCDCGNEAIVTSGNLISGGTASCGCVRLTSPGALSHGHSRPTRGGKSPTYLTWLKVSKSPRDVDPRWRDSFESFLADMGERPPGKTLDRKRNKLGYNKDNCRWATYTQQVRNRTITKMLTFNGVTKPMAQWAEELGLTYDCLKSRIRKGWKIERALTTDMQVYKRNSTTFSRRLGIKNLNRDWLFVASPP